MRNLVLALVCSIFLGYNQVFGGIFTRYDESKTEKVKEISHQFMAVNSLDKKAEYIREVETLRDEIESNCHSIFNIPEAKLCALGLKYASERLAMMRMDYAEDLVKANRKDEAKKALQSIIIDYSGGNYNGYAEKAKFLLEDLKNRKDEDNGNSSAEVEKLRLQLEIEKVKLEQERLKSLGQEKK